MGILTPPDRLHILPKTAVTAVSTDIGMVLKYTGPQNSGTVAVAANGDITLLHGALGAEVADATIGLPTLGSIIDVSDTTANTVAEVADHINASPNWIAIPMGLLRADSSNDTLITRTAAQAKVRGGVSLLRDTTVAIGTTYYAIGAYFGIDDVEGNDDGSYRNALVYLSMTMTYTEGLTFDGVKVYQVDHRTKVAETLIFSKGMSPNVNTQIDTGDLDWSFQALYGLPGMGLLVRFENQGTNATTPTVPTFEFQGFREQIGQNWRPRVFKSDY
jgi:hypothetical protein